MVMQAAAATIALAGLRGVLRLTEQAVESVLALIQVIEVDMAEVVEQAQMTLTDLVPRSTLIGFILLWGVDRIQVVEVEAIQRLEDLGRSGIQDP